MLPLLLKKLSTPTAEPAATSTTTGITHAKLEKHG